MSDDVLSGRQLGEFVLREQIGEGGYGVVYRSVQPTLKRQVVVKVLRKTDAVAEARFLREARLASQLEHPYAAHVYAFGAEPDGLRWIAMELVSGITLKDWLETRGAMALEQFVPFFECVAEVVQTAHDRGIIHRDLKPSNIMVIERGGRLIPKLLDFGIAKTNELIEDSWPVVSAEGEGSDIDRMPTVRGRDTAAPHGGEQTCTASEQLVATHGLTRTGLGIGSRPYMSPEQWNDAASVGPASDIYALGVVAYQSLSGRVPFRADNISEYHAQHLHAEVPPLGGSFSTDVDRVIRRALSKLPEDRQVSVLRLASELRDALRAQPREQLRSLAQVWDARSRPAALLLKGGDLLAIRADGTGELERSFVAASQRQAVRRAYLRRFIVTAVLLLGALWYRGTLKAQLAEQLAEQRARSAQQIANVSVTQAELEQGRSALLHGEPGAAFHLAKAYARDPAPTTAFMLARALQPRLAELARLKSSFGHMWSARFSPDGKQVVTSDDRNAQLWDTQSHELLFTLPHGDVVYQAIYSKNGERVFTAGGDGAIRLWDASNGTLIRALQHEGYRRRYFALTTSNHERIIAATDPGSAVTHVWDTATGASLAELRTEATLSASVAFSFDGRWLAICGSDNTHVFDARTWAQVLAIPGNHRLSWDPTGNRLLAGGRSGEVSLWEIPSGRRQSHLRDLGEPIDAAAFSPDGRLIIAASSDGTEQIWDVASGKLRSQGNYLHSQIRSVEFDPTSTLVVAAGSSGSIAVTDAATGNLISIFEGPRNVVISAHFDPSSRKVIGASWDGTARIWNAAPPYKTWSSPPVSSNCGVITGLKPDGRFLAIDCDNFPTHVWDTTQGQLLATLPSVTAAGDDFASSLPAVSDAGDRAALARGNTVNVYDLPGGKLLRTVAHGAAVNAVAFGGGGRDLVTGAVDGSLLVTRDSGTQQVLSMTSAGIDVAGFLPDGRLVASDAQRQLRIYDASGTLIANLEIAARSKALRMSPDSRRLLTLPRFGGKVAPPELLDTVDNRIIAQLDDQGQGRVYSSRFLPGGEVLTACSDGIARRWDGVTGQLRQTYVGGSRFLGDVTESPDGSMIVGGDGDGVMRFWDAASGLPLWTMPAHRSHLSGIYMDGDEIVSRGFSGDLMRWMLPPSERVIEACRAHESCAAVLK